VRRRIEVQADHVAQLAFQFQERLVGCSHRPDAGAPAPPSPPLPRAAWSSDGPWRAAALSLGASRPCS
jgi:hypothetical protein